MRTHGTISCYHSGCRCDDCRRAAREARRRSPSRMRRGLAFACLYCPATFARRNDLTRHHNDLHLGGECLTPVVSSEATP